MTPPRRQRRTVLYFGRVQGVGFRYTATHLARKYPVDGYVRNLPNRQVELVVEGPEADLESYLAAVAAAMGGHIEKTDVCISPATGEFDGFDIRG